MDFIDRIDGQLPTIRFDASETVDLLRLTAPDDGQDDDPPTHTPHPSHKHTAAGWLPAAPRFRARLSSTATKTKT